MKTTNMTYKPTKAKADKGCDYTSSGRDISKS